MRPFEYLRPKSIDEAIGLKARLGTKAAFLAGGTDLLVMLKDDEIQPEAVIDLSFLDTLKKIEEDSDNIIIGALASYADIASSPLVNQYGNILVQGALEVGAPQIQNTATLGGNIANASPAGDGIPPLYALGAQITIAGTGVQRVVAIEDFFTGPGKTVLKDTELIVGIRFPKLQKQQKTFFKKIGQRKALAIAKASVAAVLSTDNGKIAEARVALGAVGPTILRCHTTEAALKNKKVSAELISEVAKIVSSESRAIGDVRSTQKYRDYIVGVLFERGMREIFQDLLTKD